ncbi:putative oxidoreductase CzcO [Nocardioides aquaticus]|uniref:Oxidoreductase CzcO n=1 Tax=Nocardioides aquaticus TaxID=160826 RepID=A0ABX8EMK9_9ACTN|nr:putative oxidoreductase CzcO [Nocardioides aquaticus]
MTDVEVVDAVVVGAGQAGLSTSFHLQRRGVPHVVLDADAAPGGAWRHRWDSLTMRDVHGVAALPDAEEPTGAGPANLVVPASFAAYERDHDLPVERPVTVRRVEDAADGSGLLVVRTDRGDRRTRTLVNATGTWTRPFVPAYPGRADFTGPQWHTHDYPGPEAFRGLRTAVVGGGASAVQLLGEVALVTQTLWFTRRPPVWRTDDFTPEAGRAAVAQVEERVRRGLPPASVVSVTGLALREQERAAADLGAYRRRAMFTALEAGGVRLADGTREPVDAVLWATGFRPAVGHLAPLRLRSALGGITLDGTTAVADPRVQLVGYGPSASTIGATRAGRAAARAVVATLEHRGDGLSRTG